MTHNRKSWVSQKASQIKKHGADKASWYCSWREPGGKLRSKSFGSGAKGKKLAESWADHIHALLATETYDRPERKKWSEFVAELTDRSLSGIRSGSADEVTMTLRHFTRIIDPTFVDTITTREIDHYKSVRRREWGRKVTRRDADGKVVAKEPISVATLNKELRNLKAAMRTAARWGYLKHVPDIKFDREPKKIVRWITTEHFQAIYAKCDIATTPEPEQGYTCGDWWRGLLVMAVMTGWRIGELLFLERDDLDLENGFAITRARHNKGGRDERVPLHPVVAEHLKLLPGFCPQVFRTTEDRRSLYEQFAAIQEAAGIRLPCNESHEHSRFCHVYGFHDLRRAFATSVGMALTPLQLQSMMRHKSFATTLRYVNLSTRQDGVVENLRSPVPVRPSGTV